MPTVTLGPTPRLQFTDNVGKYVPYGRLYTKDWNTRQPKATYQDPAGLIPWSNPLELDMVGRPQGQVYWEIDVPYYLELRDKNGALIWSLAQPYVPATGDGSNVTTQIEFENLLINGQFRFFPIGEYSPLPTTINNLADGGWSFRKDGTNPDDSITFRRFTLDDTTAPTSPTYYLNYVADAPGASETYKDIVYTIRDVRTLANETITVGFSARSAIAGTYPIQVKAIQHFGTGGSPSADVVTDITTKNPTTTRTTYTGTITLPDLTGKTLGTNGDDKLEIIFRLPLNNIANLELVNVYFKRGSAVVDYPYETADEVDATIKALEIPDHARTTDFDTDATTYPTEQAYDVIGLLPEQGILTPAYLPAIPVGTALLWFFEIAPPGFLLAQGQSLLKNGKYNRLYNAQYGSNQFGAMWGSVSNNLQAEASGSDVYVTCITEGIVNPTSAGTTSFTVQEIAIGYESGIETSQVVGNTIDFINFANGVFSPPASVNDSNLTINITSNGTVSTPATWQLIAKAANQLTAGHYFSYDSAEGSFYRYFVIDGIGADPAISGRIGAPVQIDSADSDVEVAAKLYRAVVGYEYTKIVCTSAAQLTPGDYFQIGIVGQNYAPWYAIDGAGAAPIIGGVTPVRIDIASTDTNIQVATKTTDALNPLLWKMPKVNGLFPRFWDSGAGVDPDAATRTDRGDGTIGDHVGTQQLDQIKSHTHGYTAPSTADVGQAGGNSTAGDVPATTAATGGAETRAKNISFALIIKY